MGASNEMLLDPDGSSGVQVKVSAEEKDGVSDLRQSWKRLRKRATEAGEELHRLQVTPCCRHMPQRSCSG